MNVSLQAYFSLIPDFFFFWFWKGPWAILGYFGSLNSATLKFLSLRLLISTFFKPWKNEYREGLVGFSIGMGIAIKTFVIIFDILILLLFVCIEFVVLTAFLAWPFVLFVLLLK